MKINHFLLSLLSITLLISISCDNPTSSGSDSNSTTTFESPREALAGIPDLSSSMETDLSAGLSRNINTDGAVVGNDVTGFVDESASVVRSLHVGYMMVQILKVLEDPQFDTYFNEYFPEDEDGTVNTSNYGELLTYTYGTIDEDIADALHIGTETKESVEDYYIDFPGMIINEVSGTEELSGRMISKGYEYILRTNYILSDTGSQASTYCHFTLSYFDENDLDDMQLKMAVYMSDGTNFYPYNAGVFTQDADKNQSFKSLFYGYPIYGGEGEDDWRYKEYSYDSETDDTRMFSTGVRAESSNINTWTVLVMDQWGGGKITTGYDDDSTKSNMCIFDQDFYLMSRFTDSDIGTEVPAAADIETAFAPENYYYLYRYLDPNADTSGLADHDEDGVIYKRLETTAPIGSGSSGYTFDTNSSFTNNIENSLFTEYISVVENLDGTEGTGSTTYREAMNSALLYGMAEVSDTTKTQFTGF